MPPTMVITIHCLFLTEQHGEKTVQQEAAHIRNTQTMYEGSRTQNFLSSGLRTFQLRMMVAPRLLFQLRYTYRACVL